MAGDPSSHLGPITEARFAAAFEKGALLDKKATAELLGVDVKTLDAMTNDGAIRAVMKGSHRAYTERELRQFLLRGLESSRRQATPVAVPFSEMSRLRGKRSRDGED